MAERLFDQIPAVRRTVAQVAARWLLEYRDRYSFFHKLLPLILTGLNDEVLETRQEAHRLWNIIGLQYQNENENDLKDQLDYLTEMPKYYPKHLTRPNLGCRVLVQRNVSKLAKAISKELLSWQSDIRIRCSQLLCSIVLHAEADITQNLQDLLPAMYTAARDEDKMVRDNVIIASEMLGLFVTPKTWTKIILPAIEDGAHYGHLSVLAALVRGCPQEIIQPHLEQIANLLADDSICQCRKKKYQTELLNCADSLTNKYKVDTSDFGKHLFTILITLISLKDAENVSIDASHLQKLSEVLNLESKHELWKKYCGFLLTSIKKDPKSWTAVSAESCIFETILLQSEEAFGENLPILGEILVNALDMDVDAECRLKTFIALTTAMDNKQIIFKNAEEELSQFLETLVTDIFVPALVWHAGRTAEAMRTMAASCLFSALNPNDGTELFISTDNLKPLTEKLVPQLLSLTEDASYLSRQLAMQDLVLLKEMMGRRQIWDLDSLLKIYPEIAKRLDDPTEKVRICAVKSLTALLTDVPTEFLSDTFCSHHEYLIDTLLIHFDDDHVIFQDLIMDTLKTLVEICKDLLLKKVTKQQSLLRNQKGCNDIIAYLKEIDSSS
ncbi:HEAT domain-containing protein [Oryctes borbonicus]|uniref:HEAT domain-containing protein n=1 Tax=Oryctes borbonicus TaxID=1629725 RepID=A0A0T6BF25_9SCAR|nr:HEAT domain-containing protein [Oryctes borbonicus]